MKTTTGGFSYSKKACDSFLQATGSLGSEKMDSLFDGCYHFAIKSGRDRIRYAVKPSIFNGFSDGWINSAYSHSGFQVHEHIGYVASALHDGLIFVLLDIGESDYQTFCTQNVLTVYPQRARANAMNS